MKLKDKLVWIVGASGGIGEHLAYESAQRGARLILSARRTDELERVKTGCEELGAEVEIHVLDVTDSDQVASTCSKIIASHRAVDVLINNAGVSHRSLVSETSLDFDRRIMEINFFGAVDITKRMLPAMIANGGGHIAATSSLTGKFGFPLRSSYAAAKHALHGFFETLYLENYHKGIGVTVACPGRIRTDISVNALKSDGTAQGIMDPGQAEGTDPAVCARRYIRAIEKNKREVYIGRGTIMIYLRNFAPCVFYYVAKRVNPR